MAIFTITKHKSRYVLVESSEPINTMDAEISRALLNSTDRLIGEVGHAELNPKLVFQYNDRVFIMRVNRGAERKAILALAFIKEVAGKKLGLYTIKTSGTIRSLVGYCERTYPNRTE